MGLKFYFEGDQYYEDLKRSIAAASREIVVEMYFIASDDIGWEFANLLIQKAKEGVKVRMIYDDVGCRETSNELFDHLSHAGVQLKPYHPVFPPDDTWGRRNHRKYFVIDGSIAFLGGFNLSIEYSRRCSGDSCWRDTGVSITSEHPNLIRDLQDLFEETWTQKWEEASEVFKNLEKKVRREFVLLSHMRKWKKRWEEASYYIVSSRGWRKRNDIRQAYLAAIAHAKGKCWITNPYFIPDRGVRSALRRAARRGVDVQLLTAGQSDVRVALWASRAIYGSLLKSGVKIYEYKGRVLHAKSAVIDDDWFTVGTANIDHLSFFKNLEVNLFGKDAVCAGELDAQFQKDLGDSLRVDASEWIRRPWWKKAAERFFFLFRVWL